MHYVLTLLVGGMGACVGNKIRLPGSTLVGAMVFVLALKMGNLPVVCFGEKEIFLIQVLAGTVVGYLAKNIDCEQIIQNWPVIFLTFFTLTISVATSKLLIMFLEIDGSTAWLSAAPARMADMVIIATSVNADVAMVSMAHLIRIISITAITPLLLGVSKKYFVKQDLNTDSDKNRGYE